MLKSRLFWKLFAAYAVLTIVAAAAFVTILSGQQREIVYDHLQRRLHDSAVILRDRTSSAFAEGTSAELQARIESLGRETGTRLTLVAEDGTVLADSEENPQQMENHRNRPELREARAAGFGAAQRNSPTLDVPMLYYALRVGEADKPLGFVRVALTMEAVNARMARARRTIWGTVLAVGLIALTVTWFAVEKIIRPLVTLTAAAEAMTAGDLQQQVDVQGRDEPGRLAGAFNVMSRELATRIGQLQEQRTQIEESRRRLSAVLAGMSEGVIAVDESERVLFANQAARRMFEFTEEDAVGRPVWELIRNPSLHKVVRAGLAGYEAPPVEIDIPRGQSVVSLTASRLPGDPCPGLVLVFHDVTELRRLENVRKEFVSNVSHELKTPLASIQAYTDTLLDGAIDDSAHNRQFLEGIQQQAGRLYALIQDVLRLARIESGRDAFEIVPVSVPEIVKTCADQYAQPAESKGIALRVEIQEGNLRAQADPEGLRTIVNNLLDNAVKYTPDGGEVTLRCAAENSRALVEVSDTGIGIAGRHLPRIFERFYRADRARSRELGGTGLGLSIVKHLSQVFGGSVEVRSTPGKGTTFSVRIPLA